jgi:hypothetical protein
MPITKVTPNVLSPISSSTIPNSIVVRDANGAIDSIKFPDGSEQNSASTIAYVKINPVRTILSGTYVSAGGIITCTTAASHPFGLLQNIVYLNFTTGTAVDGWKNVTPVAANVFTASDTTTTPKSGNFQYAIINGTYGASLKGIQGITTHPAANAIYCVNLTPAADAIGGIPLVHVISPSYIFPVWLNNDNALTTHNTTFRVVNFSSVLTNPTQFTFCLKK